jgi:hypothetical protein
MARKQQELPQTRRDDEPPPPREIKALDDLAATLEKLKGKATKIGQEIVGCKTLIDDTMKAENVEVYEYTDARGVLKKLFRRQAIATCKVKVEKRTDEDSDDGDEE